MISSADVSLKLQNVCASFKEAEGRHTILDSAVLQLQISASYKVDHCFVFVCTNKTVSDSIIQEIGCFQGEDNLDGVSSLSGSVIAASICKIEQDVDASFFVLTGQGVCGVCNSAVVTVSLTHDTCAALKGSCSSMEHPLGFLLRIIVVGADLTLNDSNYILYLH
jgi:hypothetical protein